METTVGSNGFCTSFWCVLWGPASTQAFLSRSQEGKFLFLSLDTWKEPVLFSQSRNWNLRKEKLTREWKQWLHSEKENLLKARCSHFAFLDFFKANLLMRQESIVYRGPLCCSSSCKAERNSLLAFPHSHHSCFPDGLHISSLPQEMGQHSSTAAHALDQGGLRCLSEPSQHTLDTNRQPAFYPTCSATHLCLGHSDGLGGYCWRE